MSEERVRYLLHQYAANKATKKEVEEMFALLKEVGNKEVFKSLITASGNSAEQASPVTEEEWAGMWNAITTEIFRKRAANHFSIMWVRAAAAAILLVAGTAVFFLVKQKGTGTTAVIAKQTVLKNDVPPGGNRAVLTLADGTSIELDSAGNGLLAQQGNTKILKLGAGQLSYKTNATVSGQVLYNNQRNLVLYNTITTPRGGQYQVTLVDGTTVWLNSASSLRFNTPFTGSERNVELTGEAYFEVAKNAAMPFHVKVNEMDVQVLGTHFNVMAYSNEQTINTTLLEGKVKVTSNGVTQNMLPHQQVILDNSSKSLKVKEVNTDLAVAWKNGLFRFKETNIRELMRQVERWYDVDVEYKTQGIYQDYTGIVPRSKNVSALLQTLELTGTVHFKVNGRKITVLH